MSVRTENNSTDDMLVNAALMETGHKDPFEQDETTLTLSQIIPRIIKERGSILNVTEESLQREINQQLELEFVETEDANEDSQVGIQDIKASEVVNTEDEELDTMTKDEFLTEKNEILSLLRSALNESSLSLDFVSLLLSCVRPAAGSISMSPHLKQHVPIGSLNSASVEIQPQEREQRKVDYEKEAKVGQGWKLDSLEYSANILRDSSARLTGEILKEKEYWNSICNIVKSKEVLIKMNNGSSKDIGVKYGFGDSGSNFFDKGVGILKKNVKNGQVQFRPLRNNNLERFYKVVRVRVYKRIDDQLKMTSESNIKEIFKSAIENDDDSIGSEIAKARFYLFEEELFHELVKEATTLVPYQVQVINNKIILEMNEEIIEIEAVSLESSEDEETNNVEDSNLELVVTDSKRADYISSFLRLMLCQDHKQNIHSKFRTPRPRQESRYTMKTDANRQALLLRPLIGHSKHNDYIKQIRKICEMLVEKYYPELGRGKLSLKINKYNNIKSSEIRKNDFIRCTKVPNSKVIFQIASLKDQSKRLNFEISILNTSGFCNIVLNVKTYWLGQDKKLVDVNFSEFIDVQDSLDWAIRSY